MSGDPGLARRQRQVMCNTCDALPGEACVNRSTGRPMTGVHGERARRAKRTGVDRAELDPAMLARIAAEERERRKAVAAMLREGR